MNGSHKAVLLAAGLLALAPAAKAQSLNDIGRVLQQQVLGGGQADAQRQRDAYEQGRRDAAIEQQRRDGDRRAYDDRRRFEDERRRAYDDRDRRLHDADRQWADDQRAQYDREQARRQSGRY